MPATAGRVRMPANNRVHSSAALQTHGIWQSAIGYDPYAPNKDDKDSSQNLPNAQPDAENAYASFQGLLQLAKITNSDVDVSRGSCKKCGRVGHLKFQCKNYVKIKDDNEDKDAEAVQPLGLIGLDKKLKGKADKVVESSEEEEDSESSDSEYNSEIERILAERSGKKISGKGGSSRKKRDLDDDGSDQDSDKKRKKRGRSKKRSGMREVSDSDDSGERRRRRRKRRREHRRKRDKYSDEDDEYRHRRRKSRKERRRRRSRRSDSDSETSEDSDIQHKRKSKRASSSSDSGSGGYNDSRMGRDIKKSEKRRRHHHGGDE